MTSTQDLTRKGYWTSISWNKVGEMRSFSKSLKLCNSETRCVLLARKHPWHAQPTFQTTYRSSSWQAIQQQ